MARLQVAQQVDDRDLYRAVQRRSRLVQQQEFRFEHQGAGDGDALALTAGELMRIAIAHAGVEADLAQGVADPRIALGAIELGVMHAQAFADDLAHGQARRQGAEGVLEDDLHARAQGAHARLVQRHDIDTIEADLALALEQAQQGAPQRRLAGAGLADDADGLAASHLEIDAAHRFEGDLGPEQRTLDGEADTHIVRRQQHRRIRGHRCLLAGRFGIDQHAGVGVLRALEDVVGGAGFQQLAVTHHADAVREVAHDAQVVGDEQDRHAVALLQRLEQPQDLRLHRDIQRGGRLIGDQQVRLAGQRDGDHHALTLATGQLMGIAVDTSRRLRDADLLEQFQRLVAGRAALEVTMQCQYLDDLAPDAVQRVERGHRLLEDGGDAVAAQLAHAPRRGTQQVFAAQADGALDLGEFRQQAQNGGGRDRLAGAGLADQRQRLALVESEADALDGGYRAIRQLEVDLEVIDLHQRRRARRLGGQPQASQGVGARLVGGVACWRQAGGGAGGRG